VLADVDDHLAAPEVAVTLLFSYRVQAARFVTY
jgi:hypothetical protein